MIVSPGDVLAGKYRVERVLGIGGMGMVVSATHVELDQRVALKFMLPEALASAQATDRFLREARAAVKLRGEHVCRVLDVGKLDTGSPYIVMEFLEGEDFAQLLARRGSLHVAEAVDYILQALEGLAEAHVNNIIHRDLKPGNLFIATDNDGSPLVKVLDFGISKSVGANATKTGEIMGSPAYMAPEQMMSAKDVDPRADIWAMGVIVYHAVAGRVPFESDNLAGLCMKVLNETPVPIDQIAHVPPPFTAIVMRCLAKPREERFNDVGELAVALAPFGSADATASASRVTKVLRRTASASSSSAAIALTLPASQVDLPISRPTPTPAPGSSSAMPAPPAGLPDPRRPISTIGGGAGESLRIPSASPKPKPKWPVLAAIGAVAIVGVVAIAMTRDGGNADSTQTTQPDPMNVVKEPPPAEPKPALVDHTPPPEVRPTEVKPPLEVQPAPEVKLIPEVKPTTKPTIATKPMTRPAAGSGSAKPAAGSAGSTAVTKVPAAGSATVATPTPGSATPGAGSGSGYKGTKGKIITEYPPN